VLEALVRVAEDLPVVLPLQRTRNNADRYGLVDAAFIRTLVLGGYPYSLRFSW
jgi:hypothetical protein